MTLPQQTLEVGDSGPEVRNWQSYLVEQGRLPPDQVDGRYGPITADATRQLQRLLGVAASGAVDQPTLEAAQQHLTRQMAIAEVQAMAGANRAGPSWPPPPAGLTPLSTAQKQALFGHFAYVPAPTAQNPEAIRILDDWAQHNIVRVRLPGLARVQGGPSHESISWYRGAAEQLRALWADWEAAGLLGRVLSWGGSWAPRFVRGKAQEGILSSHAFATAFDINVAWNPLGRTPALLNQPGCVRELVESANAHGFYWGGHFRSRLDGMHFEIARLQD
ncbi:M15 family metallopeptidase [Pseudoroseomonas cervicalis]|uniref:M15 family metallopeptidase n=1 Tax=Teichococcus cervicalis TaxID=204525 RepID=UPI0022F1D7DE|nr:M15 family metallopeptidase [Pseudoroseomonas cervicalis]WBV41821.1 M15 family metallopeptidase [Pseudoroseomonas cervicalis]